MKTLRSSPCRREGVSPENEDFPCLDAGWGGKPCPMNEGCREWMRERESEMYKLGYPYAAWVVKKDLLGLSPVCSLVYFRERPTHKDVEEIYGTSVLHVAEATSTSDDTPDDKPKS